MSTNSTAQVKTNLVTFALVWDRHIQNPIINRLNMYAEQFSNEGYDDMETVGEMNFEGTKRGHAAYEIQ